MLGKKMTHTSLVSLTGQQHLSGEMLRCYQDH